MRKWILIAGAGAVVGYVAVYFALDVKSTPEPEPEKPTVSAPAEPVVLSEVVDVTNLDPLLEPRTAEPAGLPFDTSAPSELSIPVREVAPIPRAADESEESGAAPRVDPGRAVWYGPHRLPRQTGIGLPPDRLRRELAAWAEGQRPVYMPSGVNVGIGCFF